LSGFIYPDYWDVTKGIYGAFDHKGLGEKKLIRDVFEEDYEDELSVERQLWWETPFP
jgi:hypothetical protein